MDLILRCMVQLKRDFALLVWGSTLVSRHVKLVGLVLDRKMTEVRNVEKIRGAYCVYGSVRAIPTCRIY